jgi:hypothetical protein
MNTDIKNHNRFIRFTGITAVIVFGILSVLGSGGGGDDEGGGGSTDIGLLPSYAFNINTTAAYDGANQPSDGITVSVSSIGADLQIVPAVTGIFSCDPATEICGLHSIDTGSLINLFDASSPDPLVGNLSITIAEEVIIGVSGLPVIGRIHITLVPGTDFIDIEMASCVSGAGVNISYNGDPVSPISCFTWEEFEQLFDTSEEPVLIAAVFGFQVIDFLFEQVDFVTEVFGFIGDYAVDLQENGTISESCDAFSLASLVPPSGVADQGIRSLSWSDVNADSSVGPGDSFLGSLEDCWISPDQLLNGLADFTGYVENVDQNRGVITAIGFTSDQAPSTGGVFFNGFSIAETEVLSPPNAEITNVIGVEGGFSILFTEP